MGWPPPVVAACHNQTIGGNQGHPLAVARRDTFVFTRRETPGDRRKA